MSQSSVVSGWQADDAAIATDGEELRPIRNVFAAPPYLTINCHEAENSRDSAHFLGLHQWGDEIRIWNFVGAVRLDDVHVLTATPKRFLDGSRIDYILMWLRCLADSTVAEHMDEVFYCWPDEEPIEIEDQNGEISLLVALIFLRSLHILCLRHLRRNFIRISDNLVGKVKGRILLNDQFRRNLFCGRADRVACQFETISDNCLENQILKTALEKCAKFISAPTGIAGLEIVHQWIRSCRTALSQVEVRKITPADFGNIHYGGTFQHYREPHNYAKMILAAFGLDPDAPAMTLPTRRKAIPPFAICTSELFERFCEVGLRKSGAIVRPGYTNRDGKNNLGGAFAVRPDFLAQQGKKSWIVDAKYKSQWAYPQLDFRVGGLLRDDVSQVVTYSRHAGVLGELPVSEPEVLILYPAPDPEWRAQAGWFGPDGPVDARRFLHDDFVEPKLFRVAVPVPGRRT